LLVSFVSEKVNSYHSAFGAFVASEWAAAMALSLNKYRFTKPQRFVWKPMGDHHKKPGEIIKWPSENFCEGIQQHTTTPV